jgi:hypothetical protein
MAKTKRVPRKKVVRSTPALERWGGTPTDVPGHHFVPLPADRTIELRFELGEDWDGGFEPADFPDVLGARVKPVLFVAEERADLVDREAIRATLEELGAIYVRAPLVHVVRKVVRRDERHDVEIPLEESIGLFAEETKPRDAEAKVAFALELAREADAEDEE